MEATKCIFKKLKKKKERNSQKQCNTFPGHFNHFLWELNKWLKIPNSVAGCVPVQERVGYNDVQVDSI